jgi:hypothetical protein
LTGDNHGKGWETFELVITPYCGDRHLRIRHRGSWRGCGIGALPCTESESSRKRSASAWSLR